MKMHEGRSDVPVAYSPPGRDLRSVRQEQEGMGAETCPPYALVTSHSAELQPDLRTCGGGGGGGGEGTRGRG